MGNVTFEAAKECRSSDNVLGGRHPPAAFTSAVSYSDLSIYHVVASRPRYEYIKFYEVCLGHNNGNLGLRRTVPSAL